MGFFYKHILHPLLSVGTGKKAFSNNPYLSMIIDADEDDVIADELFSVGLAFQQGEYMLPKNEKKAMEYIRKAAEQGHAVAQLFMVMGLMRQPDDANEEVMYWLKQAASQGEPQAMYNLGISYHRGDIEGKADAHKSAELIRKSAEAGYKEAYQRMAIIYANGDGVERNHKIAKYWAFLDFANMPWCSRNNALLYRLLEDGDVTENSELNTEKVVREAANESERDAIYYMATILHRKNNDKDATPLLKEASYLKHPNAMVSFARQLWSDDIKDYVEARKLFEMASETGSPEAFYGLAMLYKNGDGVDKDMTRAWAYLEKAVNRGNTEARYLLAWLSMNNQLVDVLPDKVMRAYRYMELCAKDNYPPAVDFFKNNKQ